MPLKIQEVRLDKLLVFSEFASKVYAENFAGHWLNDDCSAYLQEQYSTESLRRQIESGAKYYLATKNSEYLGFMKLNFSVPVLKSLERATELEKIYFCLSAQRSGYGSILLKKAIQVSKEKASYKLILDVLSSNQNARDFYLKHGFTEIAHSTLPYALIKPQHRNMKIMLKDL